MTIYNSLIWRSDVDEVVQTLPELDELAGKSVMITGATGLICSAVVDIIMRYNDTHKLKIQVYAAGRWAEKMVIRFGDIVERDEFRYVVYDASVTNNILDFHCDYIIHGASNSYPGIIVKEPVETMLSNFTGMKCLLDYAKDYGIRRILYISSSEVYGQKEGNQPYRENEYGFVNLLNSRNSYSVGKRVTETLCVSYWNEYDVESVIVRPGHIYGPTASPQDNRVASAWVYAVARGEDIVMKSDGLQLRSYCYCLDCASAILKVLIKGENVHAYNISNPDSIMTIKQIAEMLAKLGGVRLKREVPTEEEKFSYNKMNHSCLDSSALQELGWKGLFHAERGLSHTVEILQEILSTSSL